VATLRTSSSPARRGALFSDCGVQGEGGMENSVDRMRSLLEKGPYRKENKPTTSVPNAMQQNVPTDFYFQAPAGIATHVG
jgi:hypothetical protein